MRQSMLALVLSSVIMSSSCATNAVNMSASDVAGKITVKNSEYDSTILYDGPRIKSEATLSFFESGWISSWLRSAKDKNTGVTSYGVYMVIDYSGNWRYYESASLSGGKSIKLKVIDRRVNSCSNGICSFTEQVLLPLSSSGLEAGKSNGIGFRINGKKLGRNQGSNIVIPAQYIQGFITGTT